MKLKLIDHTSHTYETTFGTCELCEYTGEATETTLYFQWEDGDRFEVDSYFWSWGDLFEVRIDNLFEFALWVGKQDFNKAEVEQDRQQDNGFSWLQQLAYDYEDYLEESDD